MSGFAVAVRWINCGWRTTAAVATVWSQRDRPSSWPATSQQNVTITSRNGRLARRIASARSNTDPDDVSAYGTLA